MRSSPRPIGPLTLTVDLEAQEVRTEAATYGLKSTSPSSLPSRGP